MVYRIFIQDPCGYEDAYGKSSFTQYLFQSNIMPDRNKAKKEKMMILGQGSVLHSEAVLTSERFSRVS